MAFYRGQKVTMKRNIGRWLNAQRFACPEFGAVYTIRDIDLGKGEVWLRFYELRNPKVEFIEGLNEPVFAACEFRPVCERNTDISVFTALLDTVKQEQPA